MFKYLLIAIALLTLSCSGTVKEEKLATTAEPAKETPKSAKEAAPPTSKPKETKEYTLQYADATTVNTVAKLDSVYTRTPYYFKSNGKTYFYICEGKWVTPKHDSFPDEITGMGIVNEQGLFILEPKYDKIYNPDATSKGYIEIEINNRKGLLNYETALVIPCEFDMIFPPGKQEAIAIGKKGNKYYRISQEGATQEILSASDAPSFSKEAWSFDAVAGNHIMLHDSYRPYYLNDANEGNGVVFTPSYLLPLGFLPEVHTYLVTNENVDFGKDSSKGETLHTKSFSGKIISLISSFYESGIDGRGYQVSNYHLATVDQQNNVLDEKMFLQKGENYDYYYCSSEPFGYTFLNDSLLEVYQLEGTNESYKRYDNMITYSYYSVDREGKIRKLESNRFFGFTKFIPLTENYFHGCFAKHIWDASEEEYKDVPGEGGLLLLDHLEAEDLDIMRNEIFAEYGYVFKSEKWRNYFSVKPWYLPRYDSVDSLLTERDKANIALILKIKEKVLQDSTIVNKRKIQYAAAG